MHANNETGVVNDIAGIAAVIIVEVVLTGVGDQRTVVAAVGHAVAIAVAEGDQWSNVQHHWLHDAMIFKSITSSVSTGLVGIPMLDVVMSALPAGQGS